MRNRCRRSCRPYNNAAGRAKRASETEHAEHRLNVGAFFSLSLSNIVSFNGVNGAVRAIGRFRRDNLLEAPLL